MTTFQIIAICILGAGVLTSLSFTLAFVVESCRKEKVRFTPTVEKYNKDEEVSEIDLDAMLAKLEEASKKKEEPQKAIIEEPQEKVFEEKQEIPQEIILEESIAEETVSEEPVVEEIIEEVVTEEPVVDVVEQFLKEEPVVEKIKTQSEQKESVPVINNIIIEKKGPEFDYRIRLEKIKDSQAKIDRDLEKTTRAILKYERTIRRKERNQKMLDRRALELTNLNLLMYSVTDIKNVDAEKKTRQEELTAHIAELKASIQDAENYLEANKEKHENNIKLSEYLTHEKTRYADEVKELEALIASGKYFDDNNGANE